MELVYRPESDLHDGGLTIPPSYSPSPDTPAYSYHPRPDEERLAITARDGELAHTLTGSFRASAKRGGIVLHLDHQEERTTIPTFGRNSIINGTIELLAPENVQRVEVELDGQLKLTIAEGGKKTRHLFNVVHTIWRSDASDQTHTCTPTLPFLVPMPNAYTEGRSTQPLPPSYQIIFPGVPGLFAHSIYTITVRVTRARKLIWKRIDFLSTPMRYYPRTRAPRMIVKQSLPFFFLLKRVPEEFCQVLSTMQTRTDSGFAPIHCLLFLPSPCIYAMTEEITFHVQLVAPITSLLAFSYPHAYSGLSRISAVAQLHLPGIAQFPSPAPPALSGASILSASTLSASLRHNLSSLTLTPSRTRAGARQQYIRVFLLRQISVEVRGQRAWRTCVLGEGTLTPSPPGCALPRAYPYPYPSPSRASLGAQPAHSPRSSFAMQRVSSTLSRGAHSYAHAHAYTHDPDADPIESLDWDGTVRVAHPAELQAGGFAAAAGALIVKDFVVLALAPPDPARNPLIALQHAHPIRLVTDPLEDVWE